MNDLKKKTQDIKPHLVTFCLGFFMDTLLVVVRVMEKYLVIALH